MQCDFTAKFKTSYVRSYFFILNFSYTRCRTEILDYIYLSWVVYLFPLRLLFTQPKGDSLVYPLTFFTGGINMCNLVEKARKKIAEDILNRIERGENITIEEFNFIEQYQEMLNLYDEVFSDTLYVLAPIDRR